MRLRLVIRFTVATSLVFAFVASAQTPEHFELKGERLGESLETFRLSTQRPNVPSPLLEIGHNWTMMVVSCTAVCLSPDFQPLQTRIATELKARLGTDVTAGKVLPRRSVTEN
jgi:hypothetical protein